MRHRARRGGGAAAPLFALLLPSPAPANDDAPTAGPARCRFAVPEGWSAAGMRWSGHCRAGLAQGRGVLRQYDGSRVARSYFGVLRSGLPALGVVELPDGFIAGRFEYGKAVNDGDRNTTIHAFDEAAAAARQLAAGYRRAGNAPSARFYEDKAKQLADQLD